eukprot:CAMPEP_0174234830 /NCGR_PEP_ID=MMETSP0417-20130205/4466_1 /TAXON_ID=242541 /ORGANISM="Mayorella sp, Strain BSH-02190019" /LENGTH=632 /DNA_ID=CAMNT_0015313247 /DNA_START=46 /DNA_END=1944 /DNA_ORIENTATION=+
MNSTLKLCLGVCVLLVCALSLTAVNAEVENQKEMPLQMEVILALRHRNLDEAEARLYRNADLKSGQYGAHLSREEIASLIGVTAEEQALLISWIKTAGALSHRLAPTGDFLRATFPLPSVQDAQDVFVVRSRDRCDLILELNAQSELSTPIAHLVQLVAGRLTTASCAHLMQVSPFPPVDRSESHRFQVNAFKSQIPVETLDSSTLGTPANQRKSYGIPADAKGSNETSSMMTWGTGTYGFLDSDLTTFFTKYGVDADISQMHHLGFMGQPGGANFGEGAIDIEYLAAIGPGIDVYLWNSDDSPDSESSLGFGFAYLDAMEKLSSAPDADLPRVLSISLGSLSFYSCHLLCQTLEQRTHFSYAECVNITSSAFQVCMYDSANQQQRVNDEFMKLGLRGVMLLTATGDGGSHFSFSPFTPTTEIGRALNMISCEYNMPTFGAASPYLVAVGGAQWTDGGSPEKPITWKSGGGGFSWSFARPSYQTAEVQAYLKNGASDPIFPPSGSFNASGRAYPDVALLADGIPTVINGEQPLSGGTSFSSPEMAGLLSLINDIRLNKGLPSLGFVTPRLYQIARDHPGEAFYDITEGNIRCSSVGFCCKTGFMAAKGWDAATGLGYPIFSGLLKYLSSDDF